MSIDVILVGGGVDVVSASDGALAVVGQSTVDVLSTDEGPQGSPARQDLVLFAQGALSASEVLARIISGGAAVYATPPSAASAGTGSTGTAVISVTKNGSPYATITFTASASGVVAFAGNGAVAAGDVLVFTAPATPDATLANVAITFASA